ncbi:MAG: class I SAM-dependent methyltransferase [Algisphaera sp.]
MTPSIAIAFDRPTDREAAHALADRLSLPMAEETQTPHDLHLAIAACDDGDTRIEIRVMAADHPLRGGHGVAVNLTQLDTTSPAGRSLRTPVLKAVGVRSGTPRPHVLDVTAGLGEDAWLLAAAGCQVTAVERHPLIHLLLQDALRRAMVIAPEIARRITLLAPQDAVAALGNLIKTDTPRPNVVLIDPMFPGRRKTAERKPMAVLRWLVGNDSDADDILAPALATAQRRVVVKRPRAAPPLAGPPPTVRHTGRGFRFDVYAGSVLRSVTPNLSTFGD